MTHRLAATIAIALGAFPALAADAPKTMSSEPVASYVVRRCDRGESNTHSEAKDANSLSDCGSQTKAR